MKKRFLYKKARKFELSAASKMIRMKFDPKHFIRYDVIKTNNLNILGSMTLTVVHQKRKACGRLKPTQITILIATLNILKKTSKSN